MSRGMSSFPRFARTRTMWFLRSSRLAMHVERVDRR